MSLSYTDLDEDHSLIFPTKPLYFIGIVFIITVFLVLICHVFLRLCTPFCKSLEIGLVTLSQFIRIPVLMFPGGPDTVLKQTSVTSCDYTLET